VQLLEYLRSVAIEAVGSQPSHVLKQDSARAGLVDEPQRLREQVAVVVLAKLLPSDGERGARHASREQVDACVGTPIQAMNVLFDNLPVRAAVKAEGVAGIWVKLDRRFVGESCLLQAE
jgi:hypothetical protein